MDNNDRKNLEMISNLIEYGDTLVDVGANVGDYTEFFKNKLNNSGKIYSIELAPETFSDLKKKFELYDNIILINKAVSDTNGEIVFYRGKDSFTNNIIGHDMEYRPYSEAGKIESIRLDSLLVNELSIKLIKIDVEGAENLVLRGLEGIVEKIKYILLECHLDEDWPEIREIVINNYGLECFNVLNNHKITYESSRPYQCLCKQKNK
jgi:FkbM family methyltransferase